MLNFIKKMSVGCTIRIGLKLLMQLHVHDKISSISVYGPCLISLNARKTARNINWEKHREPFNVVYSLLLFSLFFVLIQVPARIFVNSGQHSIKLFNSRKFQFFFSHHFLQELFFQNSIAQFSSTPFFSSKQYRTCAFIKSNCNPHCSLNKVRLMYVIITFTCSLICIASQGDLVYVNYGRREDFKLLQSMNVNCSGKIVIARYGRVFRGDKVTDQYRV